MIPSYKLDRLSEDQLSLLIAGIKDVILDKDKICLARLSSLRLEVIIPKIKTLEPQLTEEGKSVLKDLISNLITP